MPRAGIESRKNSGSIESDPIDYPVNVDFPTWMIDSLDREAGKLGVTRQSIIKVWLAERLEMLGSKPPFKRDALKRAP